METQKHGKFNSRNLDSYTKKNRFYLQNGSNIYRLLPPYGSLAQRGAIAQYWAVYWLTASNDKKKPVPSIRQLGKDKKVIVADPLFDKIDALQKSLAAQKASGTTNVAILEALEAKLQNLNLDKAYYVNVINPAGEIGVLKLRYTAWQGLKERLRELEKDGIDAVNVGSGVYFDFKKLQDDKGKTVYTVDLHKKTFKNAAGKLQVDIVEAVIDETVLGRMSKEAFDLTTLFRTLTPQEQALAATLDPAVLDRLFARAETVEEATEEYDSGVDDVVIAAPASKQEQVATAIASVPGATQALGAETVAKAVEAAAPAAAVNTAAAEVAQAAGPKATAQANSGDVNDMVAQFLATGKIG